MSLVVALDHLAVVVDENVVDALEAEAVLGVAAPAAQHDGVDGVGTATRPLQQDAVFNEPDNLKEAEMGIRS